VNRMKVGLSGRSRNTLSLCHPTRAHSSPMSSWGAQLAPLLLSEDSPTTVDFAQSRSLPHLRDVFSGESLRLLTARSALMCTALRFVSFRNCTIAAGTRHRLDVYCPHPRSSRRAAHRTRWARGHRADILCRTWSTARCLLRSFIRASCHPDSAVMCLATSHASCASPAFVPICRQI
jgi:hypothetical protein